MLKNPLSVWATLLVLFAFVGCDSKRPNASKPLSPRDVNPRPTTSAASATSLDDTEAVAALERAGAKLKRDAQNRVNEVDLRGTAVSDSLASSLAKLSGVQSLMLDTGEMSNEGWQQIGSLGSLRQLDLRECKLTNEQFGLAIGNASQLRALRLSGKNGATFVDDNSMEALAKCKDLRVLALDYLWISDVGLAKLSGLAGLSELYLANSLADDVAAELISKFSQLKKLRLARTQVSDAGLVKLAELKALEDLDLSECSQLSDAGLQSVGRMESLKRLNLWRDQISDEGVRRLSKLVNMEWLNLDNTQLSDAGLKHLSGMKKLTFLHLGSTAVSDAGMDQLRPLEHLKDLKVTRTSVTETGLTNLRTALPNTAIQLKYSENQ